MEIENKTKNNLLVDVLEMAGMVHLLDKFLAEEIDFEAVKLSTAMELWKVLKIPFGHAKKIKYEVDRRSKV